MLVRRSTFDGSALNDIPIVQFKSNNNKLEKMRTLLLLVPLLQNALGASRIFGGANSPSGQFPFIVSYQVGFKIGLISLHQHSCSGAILSPNWIVTAGRCITQAPNFNVPPKIVAGVNNLDENGPERQDIISDYQIVHPDFPKSNGPNDIALVHLSESLQFSALVQSLELSTAVDVTGEAVLAGWGSTSEDGPVSNNYLQNVTLPILEASKCFKNLNLVGNHGEDDMFSAVANICAGDDDAGLGSCLRDSGDALIQNGTLIGLGSWLVYDSQCGQIGVPSIFTRISNYLDFINQYVVN